MNIIFQTIFFILFNSLLLENWRCPGNVWRMQSLKSAGSLRTLVKCINRGRKNKSVSGYLSNNYKRLLAKYYPLVIATTFSNNHSPVVHKIWHDTYLSSSWIFSSWVLFLIASKATSLLRTSQNSSKFFSWLKNYNLCVSFNFSESTHASSSMVNILPVNLGPQAMCTASTMFHCF